MHYSSKLKFMISFLTMFSVCDRFSFIFIEIHYNFLPVQLLYNFLLYFGRNSIVRVSVFNGGEASRNYVSEDGKKRFCKNLYNFYMEFVRFSFMKILKFGKVTSRYLWKFPKEISWEFQFRRFQNLSENFKIGINKLLKTPNQVH